MSEYLSLKATINANVKTNDNHEITGSIMNSVLNAMVNSLGAGYQYMGLATPTNPGTAQTPDYKCFYLATTPGTYTYLGGLVVADGEVAILKYDSSWTKEVTGIASADKLSQLGQKIQIHTLQLLDQTPLNEDWYPTNVATSVSYADSTDSESGMPFYPTQPKFLTWHTINNAGGAFRFFIYNIPANLQGKKTSIGMWVKNDISSSKQFRMWVNSSVVENTLIFYTNTFVEGTSASGVGVRLDVDKILNGWAHISIYIDGTQDTKNALYIGSTNILATDSIKCSIPILIEGDLVWYINYENESRNKNIDDNGISDKKTYSSSKIEQLITSNPLSGKKVNWIGDSIFYGGGTDGNNGWIGRIKDAFGLAFESLAVNGALIIDPNNSSYYSISKKCTDFVETNPDFVLFDGGTNDGFNPTISPLGTFDANRYDVPNDRYSSFSSAFEYTIYQMITAYPNAKIGYVIPYKQVSYNGNIDVYDITGKAYFDRAIEICKKWGVPVLDLREKSILNYQITALQSKFTDFVHINGDGYDYSYNIVAEWMKTL